MSGDADAAAAALAGLGFAGAQVEAEGPEGEIAAVTARDGAQLEALVGHEAAREAVKRAGFRYVAVDLAE